MVSKKSVEQMSSDELFELARRREKEEKQMEREAALAQVAELEEKKKAMAAEHRKAMRAIDREIKKLKGSGPRAGGGRRSGLSERALTLITAADEVAGRDLRVALEAEGFSVKYLSQILANLKKQNKITSPSRGVYKAA